MISNTVAFAAKPGRGDKKATTNYRLPPPKPQPRAPGCNSADDVPDCNPSALGIGRVPEFAKGHHVGTPFDCDVFLSHSTTDKQRVTRLAARLEGAAFRVWFDRANIDGGEDIVTAIEQGLERSRVLVLCMTKAAFESEWVRLERNTATFRDPANHDRRFLPLRLFENDCQIPAMLYADFIVIIDYESFRETSHEQQQLNARSSHPRLRLVHVPGHAGGAG